MGASRVEAVVIPTEKATSPLHKKLIMLLDTPPGQQPTSIMPIAIGVSKWKMRVSNHATSGIMVNCAHAPIKMSSGRENSILKSCVVSVSPIVSIIMPKIIVCV